MVGTVGCPGPEISQSSKVPITSCLEFVWDQPTLLVLGRKALPAFYLHGHVICMWTSGWGLLMAVLCSAGNEGSGLSQEVFASCQQLLTILPRRHLPPGLESLNVSVATGESTPSLSSHFLTDLS